MTLFGHRVLIDAITLRCHTEVRGPDPVTGVLRRRESRARHRHAGRRLYDNEDRGRGDVSTGTPATPGRKERKGTEQSPAQAMESVAPPTP